MADRSAAFAIEVDGVKTSLIFADPSNVTVAGFNAALAQAGISSSVCRALTQEEVEERRIANEKHEATKRIEYIALICEHQPKDIASVMGWLGLAGRQIDGLTYGEAYKVWFELIDGCEDY